ncbi:MAG TPA: hypothetical protein PLY30_01575, partial [Candidatus Omnitrophota bacterium]|nr:hypothetical protein [Candidatus Omnitrophota bacterium]
VKLEVSGHDTNLDTAALKTQYRDALADTVAGTVFTKSVSGKDINYSWKSAAVEGTTYSLARSREKIYEARTGVVDGTTRVLTDDDGDIVYDIIEDFSWNFSAQTYVAPLTALTEAGSLGANLEVQEQKDQYASALLDTDRATAFTRTTSGANVSYSWKSVEGGKTYNLGYEVVKIHAADGARVEERAKWLFSEQSYVAKSVVEGRAANLSTAELKAQYAAALSDTDSSTYYTQIISGSDLSFSWESVDGGRTYSLSSERVKVETGEEDGKPVYGYQPVKWTFSAQFRVVKDEIVHQDVEFNDDAMDGQYQSALSDTDAATSFTKSISGSDISYSWKSLNNAKTYSLSRTAQKSYIPETETVNGQTRVRKDADGKVIYKTHTEVVDGRPVTVMDHAVETKWSFSEQCLVTHAEVDAYGTMFRGAPGGSLPAVPAELETQELKDQLAAALADTTSSTFYTRMTSGTNTSYSWNSRDGGVSYNLGAEVSKVLQPDNTTYQPKMKWSFSTQSYVLRTAVDDWVSSLPQDQRSQYEAALEDIDDSTCFTRAVSGGSVNYSWTSPDGIKTYMLANEKVPAEESADGYESAKWSFSTQYRVLRAEVEGHLSALDDDQQAQYTAALADANGSTVYMKTVSGTEVNYVWQNPAKTVTYSLNRTLQRLSDAAGNLLIVTPPVHKWTFASQVLVEKALVSAMNVVLENDAVRAQYESALRDDTSNSTEYTRSASGDEISFSWKSKAGRKNYSLVRTIAKVLQADGTTWASVARWAFSSQETIRRSDVDAFVDNLESSDQKVRYQAALAAADDGAAYTKAVSGNETTYSWKSADLVTTFTMLQSVPSPGIEKWSFSAQALVRHAEVEIALTDLEEDQRAAYEAAIADVDEKTEYMRTVSGKDVSYSWKSVDETKNYTLNRTMTRVQQQDGSFAEVYAAAFTVQCAVTKAELEEKALRVDDPEQRAQAAAVIAGILPGVTGIIRAETGSETSYSWENSRGNVTYALSFGTVWEETDAVTHDGVFLDLWQFSEQTLVLKSEVEGYLSSLGSSEQEKFLSALETDTVTKATVYTKSVSGGDISYSWQNPDLTESFTLSRQPVWEETDTDTHAGSFVA